MTPHDATPGDWQVHDIQCVVREVLSQHGHLLSFEEGAVARELLALHGAEGRLWARLVARVSDVFEVSALQYSDVPDPVLATQRLLRLGLAEVVNEPELRLGCLRVEALRVLCRARGVSCRGTKANLVGRLVGGFELPDHLVIRLRHKRVFRRFELLCFRRVGRTHTELVLERMGHHRWPDYVTTPALPMFGSREALLQFEDLSESETERTTEELFGLWDELRPRPAWLAHIDPRVLVEKQLTARARVMEREGRAANAAQIYARLLTRPTRSPGALVRRLAICLEHEGQAAQGAVLCAAWRSRVGGNVSLELERTGRRLARKGRCAWRPAKPHRRPVKRVLSMPGFRAAHGRWVWQGGQGIEATVVAQIQPRSALFAENGLWKTLFSLFFYDLYWLPIPGMLPVRGLSGPLDLGTPGFMQARTSAVVSRLAEIVEEDPLRILERGLSHRGERVRWIDWDLASDAMLRRVVQGVGARLLRHIFCRILRLGSEGCRGFPDLLVLDGEPQRIRGAFPGGISGGVLFVEVKGPGDTLSGAQQAWMDYLLQGGAEVEVWNVRHEQGVGAWESSLPGEASEGVDFRVG